ncbi:hypothetical protein [Fundidesulfovibrio butyratiphilus]
MSMIVLTLIGFGFLLFLAEVVFDHPYPYYLEGPKACRSARKLSLAEFLGKALPFVFTLIGLPLLFCSFRDGLTVLVLAGLSRLVASLLKARPR